MTIEPRDIPPNPIWIYWNAGRDAAPDVVKLCIDSWIAHNPTRNVIVLDDRTVTRYADIAREVAPHVTRLAVQNTSVMLRLLLLARYGGVWADATLFCTRPLDTWLPQAVSSGFFAFRDPGPDRALANWFLAAHPENRLAREFARVTNDYFRDNVFSPQAGWHRFWRRRFTPVWNVDTHRTRHWLSWPVRRVLGVYPYFVNHYLFNRLIEDDASCRAQWDAVQPIAARGPLTLNRDFGHPDALPAALAHIDESSVPMHKLRWHAGTSAKRDAAIAAHLRTRLPK